MKMLILFASIQLELVGLTHFSGRRYIA
jgi:hypothetical protein